ncbi:RsmD family RNA methyltransferase [Roseiconus lacunae]|uniref:RsmD family RNA methyltransferase n=1 Tax=Roseiconus lacunae TaxID=2605694 RepID=A0ABT7PDE6_9BACT|nr:RsmD family RNA methyltransferase [Roseiconus lacunae]MDM4014507.1 RsmD family RNA methyltransferase [Roseiconus lacunae]WRQ49820.1 RsmD family RNA methyltransferase [Stieleria sp. HD01]
MNRRRKNRITDPRSILGGDESAQGAANRPKKPQKRRPVKLRIIGGKMRGRTVVYHGAEFTRPMKDSVRENLFNILGMRVRGSDVIDLFAGTGAVTFESLSRGASSAIAIEKSRHAVNFLKTTAETLDVTDALRIIQSDTFRIAASLLGPPAADAPLSDTGRVVFFCPPYEMWESRNEELASLIRMAIDHSPPGSVIVAETDKHQDESLLPAVDWDHRVYGGTRISVYEPEMVCGLR